MSEPYLPPEDEEARVTQAKHGEQRDSFLLRTSKLLVAGEKSELSFGLKKISNCALILVGGAKNGLSFVPKKVRRPNSRQPAAQDIATDVRLMLPLSNRGSTA